MIMKMIQSEAWNKETVLKNTNTFGRLLEKAEKALSTTHLTLNQKRARIYATITQMEFYSKDLRKVSNETAVLLNRAKESLKDENFESYLISQIKSAKSSVKEVQLEIKSLA